MRLHDHTSIMDDMRIYFQIISMSKRRFRKEINSEVQWESVKVGKALYCYDTDVD